MSKNELGTENIWKLVVKYAIPTIISYSVYTLYILTDRIFVGQGVGADGLGALSIVYPVTFIQFSFAILVGLGGGSLISIALGENDREKAEKYLGNAIAITALYSIVFTIAALYLIHPVFSLLKVDASIYDMAYGYILILLVNTPFLLFDFIFICYIRSVGDPNGSMKLIIATCVLNIILDPLFIFVFKWGVNGAAIATIISEILGCAIGFWYFLAKKDAIRLRFKNLRIEKAIIRRIVILGFSPFAMELIVSVQHGIMNIELMKNGGKLAVAAMGIIISIYTVVMHIMFGFGDASQPIWGYNYGAKRYDRVFKTLKISLVYGCLTVLFFIIIFYIFTEQIVYCFTTEQDLISMTVHGMRRFMFFSVFATANIVISRFLQAIDKARLSIWVGLSRQGYIFIPAIYILSAIYGLDGIWYTGAVSDLLSGLLAMVVLSASLKKLKLV
ncbi:MAG: MATE family efflux transporter [Desulfobacterales bacterium]|nr:MATE family efflux transporter [Desulfobacterales bacterium]